MTEKQRKLIEDALQELFGDGSVLIDDVLPDADLEEVAKLLLMAAKENT